MLHGQLHALDGHIRGLGNIVAAADGNVGVHVVHFRQQVLAHHRVLPVLRAFEQLAGQPCLIDPDKWQRSLGPHFADERQTDGIGNIK